MSEYSNSPEETGLADELESYIQYEYASTGQRFLNWLIDNLVIRFGIFYLTAPFFMHVMVTLFYDFVQNILDSDNTFGLYFLSYILAIFNYLLYYPLCEKAFKGYTLGKLITGTRAIRLDQTELTFKDVLLRTVCRLVPFEALSALGGVPWHDKWTNTTVVKTR